MNDVTPGWYTDPQDARYQRWWDGYQWTAHSTMPAQPEPVDAAHTPAEAEAPTAPTPPKFPKRKKVVFSLVGAAAAAALVVGGIVVVNAVTADNGFGGNGSFEANGYLWEPVTYLDLDEPLSIPFDVDPDTLSTANDPVYPTRGVVDVYLDETFTTTPHSALVFWMEDGKGAEVSVPDNSFYSWASDSEPQRSGDFVPDDIETVPGSADQAPGTRMWAEMDRYYVVQSFDRSGKELDVPIVHTIEAIDEDDLIHEPIPLTTSIGDTPGTVKLSWEAAEGMPDDTTYYVIKTRPEDVLIDGEYTGVRSVWPQVVAETTATSWQPKAVEDWEQRSSANWELALYGLDSADDLAAGNGSGLAPTRSQSQLAVVALSGDRTERTSMLLQDVSDEIGAFPFEKADGQARDLFPADAGDLTQIPTWYPVTTLNGDTAKMKVRIDTAAIEAKYEDFWYLDGRGASYTSMPITIAGTQMTDSITAVKPDDLSEAEWLARSVANAEAYNARAEQEGPLVGDTVLAEDPSMSLEAFQNMEPVSAVPDSEYEVYGSNDFSRYLAGHLVGGTELIDLTQYLDTPGYPAPNDAILEAIRQNPMVKMSVDTFRMSGDSLYVIYNDDAEGNRRQVDGLADDVISAVIDDGMSDTEKVTAINGWIVDNMEYDYASLAIIESTLGRLVTEDNGRYSDARGGLIDKLVICGGYTDTFNLLARKAGLESIYVSGIVTESSGAHAWNRVKVDGVWKAVDTTWNDGGDETAYLLINEGDFTGSAARSTKDSSWIVPQYQSVYATP